MFKMISQTTAVAPTTLDQLRQFTTIVADTGDFEILEQFRPQDGTTNPTHILAASKLERYTRISDEAVAYGVSQSAEIDQQVDHALIRLLVGFGCEILKHVPGRVSTEVDAIYSFDTKGTIAMARRIITLYEALGISKERVLIKIASTWEGLEAARILERDDKIKCNLTLLFSLPQAILAAEANVTLISPFIGRTMDWWHKNYPGKDYSGSKDPGVKVVTEIHEYFRKHGYQTEIMAASLRSIDECVHLAGVDLMTIAVGLLGELDSTNYHVERCLPLKVGKFPVRTARAVRHANIAKERYNGSAVPFEPAYLGKEAAFRMDLFQDAMATDKIAEGLRTFLRDGEELKSALKAKILEKRASA